jgi:hypothetical protein
LFASIAFSFEFFPILQFCEIIHNIFDERRGEKVPSNLSPVKRIWRIFYSFPPVLDVQSATEAVGESGAARLPKPPKTL